MADTSSSSRRSPLYTCGAATLAIIWNLYKRTLGLNGPIGSVTRHLAKLGSMVSPLVCVIQYQWLTTLSFIDLYILLIEGKVEKYVPFSRYVFKKIDYVIDKIDSLPLEFEHVMNKLSVILEKIPVLESAKEKEIRVDTNCDEKSREIGNERDDGVAMPTMKCSYKEALEKGVNEQESGDVQEDNGKEGDEEKKEGNETDMVNKEDPLVELLDFGWETPRTRIALSRSASYT